MTTNTGLTTNTDLARRLAHVADALALYGYLPRLGRVSVWADRVYLGTDYLRDGVRDVAEWARAFDAPVVIDLSSTGRRLVAVVQLGGVDAEVGEFISHCQAYELGAALGVSVSPGGQVQVSAADLLAALAAASTSTHTEVPA